MVGGRTGSGVGRVPLTRLVPFAICYSLFAAAALAAPASPKPSFERDVRPILKVYCLDCHGAEETVQAGLDLRLRRFMVKGGARGAAIVPGRPERSLLLQHVRSGRMPPTEKKVPPEQVAVLERWIAQGAPVSRQEPERLPAGVDITPEERGYWFYQPIASPPPPAPRNAARVRNPVDAFVLARLRARGLDFSPEAERRTLIRRATFDLTGLPPSPEEVAAFLADASSDAYEKLIDRLLASPHYGERWGRHWLDVAGYADSEGNGSDDTPRPHAWRYRDYVIRSLNADKPLDRFLVEQLAGDELVPRPWKNLSPEQLDCLVATGFLRTAPDGTRGAADRTLAANQALGDTLRIVSSSLLGLTVGCAQCHDHKYDPIPQSDYYRLRAVFEPALNPAAWRGSSDQVLSLYTDEQRAKAAAVDAEAGKLQAAFNTKQTAYVAAALEEELKRYPAEQQPALAAAAKAPADRRTPEQKALLASHPRLSISPGILYQYNQKAADELKADQEKINQVRAGRPVEEFVSYLAEEPGQVPATRVFHRGDPRQPKGEVSPGDLTIAAPDGARLEIAPRAADLPTTGRRLAWARHLTSGRHPLLGRVLANRVWLHHFGRGLVDTPGDFGLLGTRPSHPELLDWLATELVREKWSLKSLHRVIMTSTTYRQASLRQGRAAKLDSDGSLYSRYPVRRLDAESLRDALLVAAGKLDRTPFGPPAPVVEDAVGQVGVKDDLPRRSVYLEVRRSRPVSMLAAFDAPVAVLNCEKRQTSTAAPQSLVLMNSEAVLARAAQFAERLAREAAGPPERVALAWRIAFQREPEPDEREAALRFLQAQAGRLRGAVGPDKADAAALTSFCQQLLSSNEFLYVD